MSKMIVLLLLFILIWSAVYYKKETFLSYRELDTDSDIVPSTGIFHISNYESNKYPCLT